MWVHRSGEFYQERPVVIYEYQKGRDHQKFLDESIPLWRDDPVMFFREVLNFEPDEWQRK